MASSYSAPRLLADIGGTNARFTLEHTSGRFDCITVLPCRDYLTLSDALRAYLAQPEWRRQRRAAGRPMPASPSPTRSTVTPSA